MYALGWISVEILFSIRSISAIDVYPKVYTWAGSVDTYSCSDIAIVASLPSR